MAMTLEELLANEGFKRTASNVFRRAPFGPLAMSAPLSFYRDPHKSGFFSDVRKTERTKSDLPRYTLEDESPTSVRTSGRRLMRLYRELKTETREQVGRDSNDLNEFSNRSSRDSSKVCSDNEIFEAEIEDGEGYDDIFSNKLNPHRRNPKYSTGISESDYYGKDIEVDNRTGNSSNKHPLRRFIDYNGKSDESLQNSKSFDDSRIRRLAHIEQNVPEPALEEVQNIPEPALDRVQNVPEPRGGQQACPSLPEPALDKVAVQAMISILSGYIKCFLNDQDFRTSLHDNCFAVLNSNELDEGITDESNVITTLERAIETVEGAAEDCASGNELKKASLQLSLITGFSLEDLKDGSTSGIPNRKLSACAHLYLSVIYVLKKKDRIAAKHLLHVFCASPFEARTMLLPELWDHMFLPHLSHLKSWYDREANSLPNTPSKTRKLKLLEKVYNEVMDSGTHQFAVYYKDWLTEGVEAPSIPSVHVPSIPVQETQRGCPQSNRVERICREDTFSPSIDVESPSEPFSPIPMVSKRLYDAVFGRSRSYNCSRVKEYKVVENLDHSTRSSDCSNVEGEHKLSSSSAKVKRMDQNIERDNSSHHEDGLTAEDSWRLRRAGAPSKGDPIDKFDIYPTYPEKPESTQISQVYAETKANELTLKRLAKSIFELQETDGSMDLMSSFSSSHTEFAPCLDSTANSIKTRSSDEESHGGYDNINEESSCSSIPLDFTCPLTGLVFEDPVTLETGQTFERAAISEWFNQGNRKCPVTGKTLECQYVPVSNFILKRVIDSWKSEHCNYLLALASQAAGDKNPKLEVERVVLLEQLLNCFSNKQRITIAKIHMSLGGLQFLVQRFESGNMEVKTRVAALFSSCIEAEGSCRDYIARNIKKPCLLELIHSKQVKLRTAAVSLLMELICLNRRKDVNSFLSGLVSDGILDTMHVLLHYLHSSPTEERPLVAVLLLHLDLLVEPWKNSIYRAEAVDAIAVALDGSLSNKKIRAKCCQALLILGGCFSSSGKIITEDWIVKQTGFREGPYPNSLEYEEDYIVDDKICSDDEDERKEWLRRLSASLIGDGKKSFLGSISKCLGSQNLELVRVCLTTVAWLSSALASLPETEFQLSALSALISRLKEILENDELVVHRILANLSLLNFSNIPECRVLLMAIAEELAEPLRSLAEVTWTAGELYALISGEDS
ncbi:hypothetical protein Vadar_011809 [Vaccinium darrowii]|uniref:Uncharacterized protein n=1 Tax=Vaccinium darrowii TaxID=229202 RepID=A0ACB7Y643_9ERIC|nr:hypothetical protein Vadar_011809 [Vaccinium darrowii]